MRILIYNEGEHDQHEWMRRVYPDGLHGALRQAVESPENQVDVVTLSTIRTGITREILAKTDVMLWWGHALHHLVPDETVEIVKEAVQMGMGIIFLHSAHLSKPFRALMGTSCTLSWRDNDRERLWVAAPAHPIAQGLPRCIELEHEEMYGEPFDIPTPDEVVFLGWFAGGEVFRSGVTYHRGYGKVFYFQPGHEEFPIYYHPQVIRILQNAVKWAAPAVRADALTCPNPAPAEQ